MPVVQTANDHVVEAVVSGPDGANRLYTCTGAANSNVWAQNEQKTVTVTFLVGPTLTRRQFIRGIATASVDQQVIQINTTSIAYIMVEIPSVEADWDDESNRVEVRVELGLQSQPVNVNVGLLRVRYWVTILAEI